MPQMDRTIVFIVIINITIVIIVIINIVHLLGRGGGVLWISSDGDYQMGAKIKTQNNP